MFRIPEPVENLSSNYSRSNKESCCARGMQHPDVRVRNAFFEAWMVYVAVRVNRTNRTHADLLRDAMAVTNALQLQRTIEAGGLDQDSREGLVEDLKGIEEADFPESELVVTNLGYVELNPDGRVVHFGRVIWTAETEFV